MSIPTPVQITDADLAFPARALEFMPKWEDIPEEFRNGSSPWCDLQRTWFAYGLSERFSFQPATIDGALIDALAAYRQLAAIQGTYACKHEHKIAAVAYLASLWMESVIYSKPGTPDDQLTVLGEAPLNEWLAYFQQTSTPVENGETHDHP